jgi:RNA polymerase sigma-70 factor (ECF subfamily)
MSLLPDAATDGDLWRAAAAGSADAWGGLFQRHHTSIYAFCFRRTGDRAAAEDLTSAVFLQAWRSRDRARVPDESVLPWLYGVAAMLTRNHHRTLRRYKAALERMRPEDAEPDPAPEVVARLDARRKVEHLRELLAALPQKDRDVLELAAEGTLSVAEIAVALDIPVGTVKSRISRARARLKARLDEIEARGAADSRRAAAPESQPETARGRYARSRNGEEAS